MMSLLFLEIPSHIVIKVCLQNNRKMLYGDVRDIRLYYMRMESRHIFFARRSNADGDDRLLGLIYTKLAEKMT